MLCIYFPFDSFAKEIIFETHLGFLVNQDLLSYSYSVSDAA
jgi:hypothetical protein